MFYLCQGVGGPVWPALYFISGMAEEPRFFIDLDRFHKQNRDFKLFVRSRICPECLERVGEEVEERRPTVDPQSGRVVFQTVKVRYGEDPFECFLTHCGRLDDFIPPNTPLLEAVFRVFLANGNRPLTIDEIRQELEVWPGVAEKVRALAPEALERIIRSDDYYGFAEVAPVEEGATAAG